MCAPPPDNRIGIDIHVIAQHRTILEDDMMSEPHICSEIHITDDAADSLACRLIHSNTSFSRLSFLYLLFPISGSMTAILMHPRRQRNCYRHGNERASHV